MNRPAPVDLRGERHPAEQTRTVAPVVAGVTFVIGAEMTRRRLAERALETILSSHSKMVGVVLNKVDFARNRYYYSRYYGHQYKSYYGQSPASA